MAPHPFFPASYCLRERLLENIDLFDAVEFSHFYTPRIDLNRSAVRLAREVGLPLLGTSDSHFVQQLGTTYSLIEGEMTVASILAAIRKGQVHVMSRPLTITECLGITMRMVLGDFVSFASGFPPSAFRKRTSEGHLSVMAKAIESTESLDRACRRKRMARG